MIETDRIGLRKWCDSDRQPFAQMNRDPDVMEFLGGSLSRQHSDNLIDRQIKLIENDDPAFWAAERRHDNRFIGCIGVKRITFKAPFTPCYEIGWRLGKDYWGQGYATEGAKAALDLAFDRWNIPTIYSFTVPANIPSQSVMKKIGMHRVTGGDFRHSALAPDDPLSLHVLYRIDRANPYT